jgi:putative transposase
MNMNSSALWPYHLSARCLNKEWFHTSRAAVWKVMEEQLYLLHHGFGFQIWSFVLMSNHFHLMVTAPSDNLGEGMNYFMRETSRRIGFLSNRINHIYGARFHRSLIDSDWAFHHVYKYIYRNPVEAALCQRVEEYPYSTLHGLIGLSHLIVPVAADRILFRDFDQTLRWLNTRPLASHREVMRRGLHKRRFRLAKDPRTRGPHRLETELY